MGKLSFRMGADVLFDLRPIPAVVANLFTGSTNRQQSSQGFNVGEGISQLLNESLALLFQLLLHGDIHRDAKEPGAFGLPDVHAVAPRADSALRPIR